MQPPRTPWLPRVGDHVSIKGSRLLGQVLAIEGSGADLLFILDIQTPDVTDPGVALRLAVTALRSPTVYRLDDLLPHP
jgi:hypothetical protein